MPAESTPLLDFIDAAKGQGAADDFVVALLRQNGWSEKRIYQAFGTWYETRTGATVPNDGGRIEAAKDAFFYLLAFITLGIWTIQLGALLFTAIDRTFPNPSLGFANYQSMTRTMANELASIMVAFPLFIYITRAIVQGTQQQPERLESSVRKWLTYIALVITASTMITDLVTFLEYLLRGDLSTKFVLKVLVVLVIAGGVFAYYLDSLRSQTAVSTRNRLFAYAALAVAAFGIIVGFVQIGSPAVQRAASEDVRRLYDLSFLAQGIHVRLAARSQLPQTIQEVQRVSGDTGTSITDPVSGQPYEYIPLQGVSYRLCATFNRPSPDYFAAQWAHTAGHFCFTRNAIDDVQLVQREW